jgi:predicted esterase
MQIRWTWPSLVHTFGFDESPISRRKLALGAASLLASSIAGTGCNRTPAGEHARLAMLRARPITTVTTWKAGTRALGLESPRDAVLHLPPETGQRAIPLIVVLHGAGGDGEGFLRRLRSTAGPTPVALLAPDSRGSTWDAVSPEYKTLIDVITLEPRLAGFGPDVTFLDQALERVFQVISVDPARVAIAGFSDGASYALALGLINGDLFKRVIAFSPGFIPGGSSVLSNDRRRRRAATDTQVPGRDGDSERPSIFVSHGRVDRILPIERSSRRIVPALRERGYEVSYREFDGGHGIPDAIAREAIAWAAEA